MNRHELTGGRQEIEKLGTLPLDCVRKPAAEIPCGSPSLERLARGFRFLEGPVWVADREELIFSDIPGNALYTWSEASGVRMIRENSYLANGNSLDCQGNLITCEHGTSRLTRTCLDTGSYTVLADTFGGKALNSPNDVIVKSDGSIYFTDPIPGRQPRVGIPRAPELGFCGIYRYDDKAAFLYLLDDSFTTPNGLCFGEDESELFVNDSASGEIFRFRLNEKGLAAQKTLFGRVEGDEAGCADGMKYHPGGFIFCTGPGGIFIFDRKGEILARMKMPEVAANIVFNEDFTVLYAAASTSIYRIVL